MKASPARSESLDDIKDQIELFLLDLRHPVLTEPGRVVVDLSDSTYSLSTEYGKLLWHVWNEQTNFVRQITSIRKNTAGRMELSYQKFGKGPAGTLVLSDSRAAASRVARQADRLLFAQKLRGFVAQVFPQWKLGQLSSPTDLKRSFSGRYTRGLLTRGQSAWGLIAAGEQEDPSCADGILTYGLIWLDHLRQINPGRVMEGLKIFVPSGQASATAARLSGLNSQVARFEIYETGSGSFAGGCPFNDARLYEYAGVGNLRTGVGSLRARTRLSHFSEEWIARIRALSSEIDEYRLSNGFCALGVRGLAVVKETPKGLVYGVGRSETAVNESSFADLQRLISAVLHARSTSGGNPEHPYYRLQQERWMESVLLRDISRLGFDLVSEKVREQVPTTFGIERGIMDLLAVTRSARLVILELKASEDVHLPLQALDYWLHVRWHQQRGYFERGQPGASQPLSPEAPLLLLVCPGLQFHSSCERIIRYFAPEIEVFRVGVNEGWREQLQVVFRAPR